MYTPILNERSLSSHYPEKHFGRSAELKSFKVPIECTVFVTDDTEVGFC